VRDVITTESVLGDRRDKDGAWQFRLEADSRIAHIRISSFGDRTATEFARIMQHLSAAGVQAVVLDLRDNPGGSLDAAVAVCRMLLPAGKTIVETRGRGQIVLRRYSTDSDGAYVDLPVAVLVNHQTASAGEIVAACLQDHRRALIVGERTYGKATVQQLLPLEAGRSLLKLTWASFWRPSGRNIHHPPGEWNDPNWGVAPDEGFERALSPEEYKTYLAYRETRDDFGQTEEKAVTHVAADALAKFIDRPLQAAVEYLQSKFDGEQPRRRL
jgi:carboxyl-terminal processing protease